MNYSRMSWRFTVAILLSVTVVLVKQIESKPSLLESGHNHPHHEHDHAEAKSRTENEPTIESAEDLTLNADGSYSYKYRLSDGTFSFAKANSLGEVIGGFGYKNPEGRDVTIEFKASKDVGFQPKGSHLNKLPNLPGISQEQAIANDDYYDDSSDRSYKFEFVGDEFSRDESADSNGKIVGNYKFLDSNGQERQVTYEAGAGIGFVPVADFIPKPETTLARKLPSTGGQVSQKHTVPALTILPPVQPVVSSGYPAAVKDAPKFYGRTTPTPPSALYSLPGKPSDPPALNTPHEIPTTPSTLYAAPELPILDSDASGPSNGMVMDASYAFAYDNDEAARKESSDPNGNVHGEYTYVNTEGNLIQVKYSAGANIGFVIENESDLTDAISKATIDGAAAADEENGQRINRKLDKAEITFVGPEVDDNTWIQSKTYTFGFRGQESSRSEVSDKNGKVKGTYTIPDKNGIPILVKYTAGPKLGFVVENLEEVQRRTGQLDGASSKSQESSAGWSGAPTSGGPHQRLVVKVAPKSNQIKTVLPPSPTDSSSTDHSALKSYHFQYDSSDSGRFETADEDGNIRGQYEYINAEGNKIQVTYSAGPGKGFVVENEEDLGKAVSKATVDGAASIDRIRKVVKKGEKRKSKTNDSLILPGFLPRSPAVVGELEPIQVIESAQITTSKRNDELVDARTQLPGWRKLNQRNARRF